ALRRDGERCLDALLAELLRADAGAGVQQAHDVRALRPLLRPRGDRPPQPRREAGDGPRVARRPCRTDAQQDDVAVALAAQLLDRERVAGGRTLVPDLLARPA